MAEKITLERRDGIATITLNRPEKRNAIDFEGWQALRGIAGDVAADGSVRVVILRGAGEEAFSAGADIKDFQHHRYDASSARRYADVFEGALDAVEALPQPTISLIKGFCVGGGCELSMATDIRIASDNSRFGVPVAKLGILVGYKEMRRLVNLVGPGSASYILLTGRQINATEALRIGLINSALPLAEVTEYVYALAQEMLPLSPLSQRRHKEIMRTVLADPGLTGLSEEQAELPFTNFASEDFQEGRRAFIERRPPRFTGK
ncbi:MAG: hypothetical protein FJ319_09065 [SAR202 cluster bacterium]|nr:hypothetical protein [SAR202 cluster bacterium]